MSMVLAAVAHSGRGLGHPGAIMVGKGCPPRTRLRDSTEGARHITKRQAQRQISDVYGGDGYDSPDEVTYVSLATPFS
jgi:hypothetical protein